MKTGFDNKKYLDMQTQKIMERVEDFGGKLYMEFGGKLFDDYHASRVLPGFAPDSKIKMLSRIKDQVEIVITINAQDIASNKVRGDLGITYEEDVLRLYDALTGSGLFVGSIVISRYTENNHAANNFLHKLENAGIKVYRHYSIAGYPSNISHIVSDEGFGKNDYIETTRNIVVVTAPGPGSGKMATCLSQLYHDSKRGIKSGYAKYETFPIWNLPLNHPVNIAYEAATADLNDVNMIDPWHLQAYGVYTVNYNRDVEVFPVLNALFTKLMGKSPYQSPTDMGVNMAGYCICDDEACCEASKQEIIRRYLKAKVQLRKGRCDASVVDKLEIIMSKLNLTDEDRPIVSVARKYAEKKGKVSAAIELPDGRTVCGKSSKLLSCGSSVVLNALKILAGLPDVKLISLQALEPIQNLKKNCFRERSARLNVNEALIALSASASVNPMAELALEQLPKLRGCQAHLSAIPFNADEEAFLRLGLQYSSDPNYPANRVYFE